MSTLADSSAERCRTLKLKLKSLILAVVANFASACLINKDCA